MLSTPSAWMAPHASQGIVSARRSSNRTHRSWHLVVRAELRKRGGPQTCGRVLGNFVPNRSAGWCPLRLFTSREVDQTHRPCDRFEISAAVEILPGISPKAHQNRPCACDPASQLAGVRGGNFLSEDQRESASSPEPLRLYMRLAPPGMRRIGTWPEDLRLPCGG